MRDNVVGSMMQCISGPHARRWDMWSRRRAMLLIPVTVALLVVLVQSSAGYAAFGVRPDPLDPDQPDFHVDRAATDHVTPYDQAGGHDFDFTVAFNMNTIGTTGPDGHIRSVVVDLPPGLVGDPTATPTCRAVDLVDNANCSPDAQVGVFILTSTLVGEIRTFPPISVYNVERAPGDVATFGFYVAAVVVTMHARIRQASDYGVRTTIP